MDQVTEIELGRLHKELFSALKMLEARLNLLEEFVNRTLDRIDNLEEKVLYIAPPDYY